MIDEQKKSYIDTLIELQHRYDILESKVIDIANKLVESYSEADMHSEELEIVSLARELQGLP